MVNALSALPGFLAPPHHQPTEEEFFFITANALTVTLATETRSLPAGAFAFCPRNCTHAFGNESQTQVQFVTLNSPAGHERGLIPVRALLDSNAPRQKIVEAATAGGWVMHDMLSQH